MSARSSVPMHEVSRPGRTGVGRAPDSPSRHRPTILTWNRLLLCLLAGAVVAVAAVAVDLSDLAVLAGCAVAGGALLAWAWRVSWPRDAAATKRLAEEEGRTRVTDTTVLVATVASLVAVVQALVRSDTGDAIGVAAVVLGVLVVIVSWALVNTVFALKYARHYYTGQDGGLEFGQREPPTYSDFAYLAFSIGMSFGVPDIALQDARIRKTCLGHALMSYLFGTFVIAVAVNLVTNLGNAS